MQQKQLDNSGIRLAEVIAALSLATDLGMGQPMEWALCSCVLAVRLGETLGLSERERREIYYLSLLHHIGCNAIAHSTALIVRDELAMRAAFVTIDPSHLPEVLRFMLRHSRAASVGTSPFHTAALFVQWLMSGRTMFQEGNAAQCEVAQRLADRLGFDERIQQALGQVAERWDGQGAPRGLKGENILPTVRVISLAQDIILFHRLGGLEAAVGMAKERAGGAYDPRLVEHFCQRAEALVAGLDEVPSWDAVLAIEPGERPFLSEKQFDRACRAIADFADMQSPYLLGHSSGVAELAAAAARKSGLPECEAVALRRAGMLHDVGRTGVSAGIWAKPGPLSEKEWEQVRLHAYYTERILARPATLARLGALASLHHERLDGSGYHRGAPASQLSLPARILAAADVYHALIEPRPHRPARTPEAAANELQREAWLGRLDSEAVNAVIAAAGHRMRPIRREMPAGLSEREVEVLRLLARGHSMKQIAALLTISPKTVDRHIQHIYSKIGVSTRAAATLFAMQHDLLTDL